MEFLVVPDNQKGAAIAAGIPQGWQWDKALAHSSGRPWIVGSWNDKDILAASRAGRRCWQRGGVGL